MRTLTEQHMVKIISNWGDLRQYGIIPLTGEACSLSMRLLCDVTGQGIKLVEQYLGGTVALISGQRWNASSGDNSGSIMISYDALPSLSAFALHLIDKFDLIVKTDRGTVIGVKPREIEAYLAEDGGKLKDWRELIKLCYGEIDRVWSNLNGSIQGRCVHQMSGRLE